MMRMMAILLFLTLAPWSGRAAVAADPPPTEKVPEGTATNLYAVVFTVGPNYSEEARAANDLPGMADHAKFIKAMHASGVVPLAGPVFADDQMTQVSGALYFVRAGSRQEAREVVMKEPLVREKIAVISSIWLFHAGVGTLD